MKNFKKVAESLKDFVKASNKQLLKTAEDEELFEKGRIFGMGMAEGFLEKIAQELQESEPELPQTAPAEPEVAPQQVESEATSSDLEQIKVIMRKMTPRELAEWLLQQDAQTLKMISDDADLSSMANEALRLLEQMEFSGEEEEVGEEE